MTISPKNIVITGGSSGIGAALAKHYSGTGIILHISGRNQARLTEVADQCRKLGATVYDVIVDVSNMDAMTNWFALICQQTGVPDLVVANAGIAGGSINANSPATIDDVATRDIMAINIAGVLNTLLPVIPRMVEQHHGQVAIISSLAGYRGMPSSPAYSASKVAVKAYGEALRPRLAPYGVNVNVVMPGFVKSRITDSNDFSMPMIMSADTAAGIIADGLKKNRARIAFPLPMAFAMWLVGVLPPGVIDPLLKRLPSKI